MSNPSDLKMKAMSLGKEISGIRFEEKQLLRLQRRYMNSKYRQRLIEEQREQEAENGDVWTNQHHKLNRHRLFDLKPEARATNIARGFLKHLPYEVIETYPNDVKNQKTQYLISAKRADGHAWQGPQWHRVIRIIEKFGTQDDLMRFHSWLNDIGLGLDINAKVIALN